MEALAALSLASNVVQFVDFTWKLIAEARTIRKSATGCCDDSLLLDTILSDVERLNKPLADGIPHAGSLQKLVSECIKVAAEVRAVIKTLKADKKNSTWSSFQVALSQVSKKGKLEHLTSKLAKIQSQIAQHLLFELQ